MGGAGACLSFIAYLRVFKYPIFPYITWTMPIKRFRKGTYNSYFKRKMMKRGRSVRRRTASFKTRVQRVLMRKAETKKYQFAAENVQLQHNIGYNSNAPPLITLGSMTTFFNIWADIQKGTSSHQRIGDRITPRGMSLKIWYANKVDRPNCMFRVIVARAPKAINGVATAASSITDPFDQINLGATANKLLLPLDKDRGIKALYDRVHTVSASCVSNVDGPATKKERTKYLKLWFRNKKSRDIIYDSTNSDQIVNNPVLLWIIPYEQYSTAQTDQVASCSYYGTIYYKDV